MSAAQNPYDGLSSEGLPDELRLGEPVTDATHAEFLQLLDAVAKSDDAGFLAAYDEWIAHTRHHFEQEEQWMEAMQFGPRFCHTNEHKGVLQVVQAVRDKIAQEVEDPEGPGKGGLSLKARVRQIRYFWVITLRLWNPWIRGIGRRQAI